VKSKNNLIRPKTFDPGRQYLYIELPACLGTFLLPLKRYRVNFEAYDVCPAFIIVKNGSGERWRCARERLFIPENPI
jgi:hypothetical protein